MKQSGVFPDYHIKFNENGKHVFGKVFNLKLCPRKLKLLPPPSQRYG